MNVRPLLGACRPSYPRLHDLPPRASAPCYREMRDKPVECVACRAPLTSGSRFCNACGARQPDTVESPSVVTQTSVATGCTRHAGRTTLLRCGRCLTPYCHDCLTHTPAGLRCDTCAGIRRPLISARWTRPFRRLGTVAIVIFIVLALMFARTVSRSIPRVPVAPPASIGPIR